MSVFPLRKGLIVGWPSLVGTNDEMRSPRTASDRGVPGRGEHAEWVDHDMLVLLAFSANSGPQGLEEFLQTLGPCDGLQMLPDVECPSGRVPILPAGASGVKGRMMR